MTDAGKRLKSLVAYLSDEVHQPAIVSALLSGYVMCPMQALIVNLNNPVAS